jgi:hypothetical protein
MISSVRGVALWLMAIVVVVVGIVELVQGRILFGIALIFGGCVVGPGSQSLFRSRRRRPLGTYDKSV